MKMENLKTLKKFMDVLDTIKVLPIYIFFQATDFIITLIEKIEKLEEIIKQKENPELVKVYSSNAFDNIWEVTKTLPSSQYETAITIRKNLDEIDLQIDKLKKEKVDYEIANIPMIKIIRSFSINASSLTQDKCDCCEHTTTGHLTLRKSKEIADALIDGQHKWLFKR